MRPEPREAAVSGIAKTTPARVTRPRSTSMTKIERQPNHTLRNPPTAGPTPGVRLWTMVSNAMREVASPGPALSRTIARPKLVPVLPLAAADFGVSRRGIQQAITLYLFGIAGGQLLYGPVSDRFGRRPTLIAGLVLYITAGAVAGWAATIGTLLIARVLQVVGGCGGLVCWVALLPVRHSLPICTSPRYRWRSQQPAAKMAHARDLTAAASSASRTSPRRQPCGHACRLRQKPNLCANARTLAKRNGSSRAKVYESSNVILQWVYLTLYSKSCARAVGPAERDGKYFVPQPFDRAVGTKPI